MNVMSEDISNSTNLNSVLIQHYFHVEWLALNWPNIEVYVSFNS